MAPKIFILGVTGYIGGHVTAILSRQHPEYELITLVRNEAQSEKVKSFFTDMTTVIGDLDSHDTLVDHSSQADIVINLAHADHAGAAKAIIEGLAKGDKKGRYIHTSGSNILSDISNGWGSEGGPVYGDITDIDAIKNFDKSRHHREVDIIVLEGGKESGVPTAIICPCTVHGTGKGPVKTRSVQIPALAETFLKVGRGFMVGQGTNIWNQIHISDLAEAYALLVEEGLKENGGSATWGEDAYYFVEAGEFKWGDVAMAITEYLNTNGYIKIADLEVITIEQARKVNPWADIWANNSRSRSERLPKLGWKPRGPDIFESVPDACDEEITAFYSKSSEEK